MTPAAVLGRNELRFVRMRQHLGVDDRVLRRGAERGVFTRLRNGAYVPTDVWSALTAVQKERLAVAAAHDVQNGALVATHRSAAALWGVPPLHAWDGLVEVRVTRDAGSRVEHGYRKRSAVDQDLHLTRVDGIPCTTLARTVVDLAATAPFADAVVAADWALAQGLGKDDLRRTLDELAPLRGRSRMESVIDFAQPLAASPGESLSRVQIAQAGLPRPELQVEFRDGFGLIGVVDFFWPDFALIGEFDGAVKYSDPTMLAGRTPQQALMAEKRREDRLRATGPSIARWVWAELMTRGRLAAILRAAGMPDRS